MKANIEEIHSVISEIESKDNEGITKTSLVEISELSEKNWSNFKEKLFSGDIQVREMTTSPISFQVFAANSDKAGFMLFNSFAFVLPFIAVAFAFIYSWWFIFLVFGSIFFFRIAKSFYRAVIFQAVTVSEASFCFMFSRNTICLLENGKLIFRENE